MVMVETGERLHMDGPITPECVRAWNNAYVSSRMADSVWFPKQLTSFRGRFRRRTLQDLVLVDVEADPFGVRFTGDSPVTQYIGVSVNTRTFSERVVFGDHREYVVSAPVEVWDATTLVESEILGPMSQTVVLVPKPALHMSRSNSLILDEAVIEGDQATLRLLRGVLLTIAAEADRLSPTAISAARNVVVELLLSAVQEYRQPSKAAVSESMRLSVSRWIDDHLHLGHVLPARAAEQHGISVRSLHRLFADSDESFGSLVRRRRLERAYRDLLHTGDMVQTIAMRWGYADASHFINDFKRVYGSTPASYRKVWQKVPDRDAGA
ncbi:AraC-like DNA-binding protein [Planomonospora venezuelensis]|uniref:AraC-like DNA-binding protein n=2 Tax=Planomonospora venezuelensis TaxID=1999 RepID=A0A841DED8_PLAVE|nr:AraC-like DNA-binding protein [Planomonospora venezuelensis]